MAIRNGTDGDDRLVGTAGDDTINGFAGNDIIAGRGGDDDIDAGGGDDVVYLVNPNGLLLSSQYGPPHISLSGIGSGGGNDTLVIISEQGVFGSSGFDTVFYGKGGDYTGLKFGYSTVFTFFGNGGDDVLCGGDGNDRLFGGEGNDFLRGFGGSDQLAGGARNDVLQGHTGQDFLTGGTGVDRFVYGSGDFGVLTRGGCDRIRDFSQAEHDQIVLNVIDADHTNGIGGQSNDAFTFIGTDAFHGTAGELRYEQVNGNTFVMGDQDGDAQADFMLALLGQHTLTADDFVL